MLIASRIYVQFCKWFISNVKCYKHRISQVEQKMHIQSVPAIFSPKNFNILPSLHRKCHWSSESIYAKEIVAYLYCIECRVLTRDGLQVDWAKIQFFWNTLKGFIDHYLIDNTVDSYFPRKIIIQQVNVISKKLVLGKSSKVHP